MQQGTCKAKEWQQQSSARAYLRKTAAGRDETVVGQSLPPFDQLLCTLARQQVGNSKQRPGRASSSPWTSKAKLQRCASSFSLARTGYGRRDSKTTATTPFPSKSGTSSSKAWARRGGSNVLYRDGRSTALTGSSKGSLVGSKRPPNNNLSTPQCSLIAL